MGAELKALFNKIEVEDIDLFESELKIKLPDDYRQFLISFNGGMPSPNSFKINEAQGESILSVFYGIILGESKFKSYDIKKKVLFVR